MTPLLEGPRGGRLQITLPKVEWPELKQAIEKYRDSDSKLRATYQRLSTLRNVERERAEVKDRRALKKALSENKSDPGTPETDKIDKEIEFCKRHVKALEELLDEAEMELLEVLQDNRETYLAEIEARIERARDEYGEAVEALVTPRRKLSAAQALLYWVRDFPEVLSYRPSADGRVLALVGLNGEPMFLSQILDALRQDAHPPQSVEKVQHPGGQESFGNAAFAPTRQ
jgi:hypothetical protein